MQTPTPPPAKRFGAPRAVSVCSQRYPGSVKSGVSSGWKSRLDDDDIPSDESDIGGKRPFGVNMRTRIRKRRAISVKPVARQPVSSGRSWMSTGKCARTESVCVPSSSCSNVTTEKNVKKALFQPPSNLNKSPPQVRPGPSGLHGTKTSSIHSNLGQQKGVNSLKSHLRTTKEIIKSGPSSNLDPVACKTNTPVDWVLYSIWHPAWDVIWKCDNGKRPLSQNQYFRKLIMEVLAANTTSSDISSTIDLKVIKVQDIKEDSQGKLTVIGTREVEAIHRAHLKKKQYKRIRWNPTPDLLGRLLKYVVSASDLIVQYRYPASLETINSRGKLCFIHITPKDGQPIDYFELSKMGAQVSAYNINYDYYKPKIIKCVPFRLTRTKKIAQEPVDVEAILPVTVVDKVPVATSKNLADYVFGSPGPSPISHEALSGARPNAGKITDGQQYQEPVNVGRERMVSQSLSPLSEQIEEMEISDCEELDVNQNPPSTSRRAPLNEKNDFNLTSFLSRGQFVPGPLRPKVMKPNKPYVYHTLEQLAEKLNASIADDVAKGVVPNMLVKHQCNTYGVVVEIKNQIRHENAYFVRVSDETMDSVLLRIHKGIDQSPGPRIELGNIIRVHRLTVQNEWDTEVSDNTMVLSTAAHHNYVLFEQADDQLQFYYNTCAKSVTLSNVDKRRVGELQLFKSQLNIPANEGEVVPLSIEQNGIAPRVLQEPQSPEVFERDSIVVVPPSQRESDGICGSDLASPSPSDVSIWEDNTDTQSDSMLILNESRHQTVSNSRSDESFFSATSDLDQPGNNDNRPQTRSRKSADTSIERKSQNITFTLFKDLKMTNEPVNLLCQIISMNEHREGIWCLIVKDMEETVPSGDFNQPQSSVANPSGFQLSINIKNGIGLEKRDLLTMLLESQGTDEFYFISNVMVKGTQPPYTLEIDANVCDIRRYKHLIRFLELDETFTAASQSNNANPHESASSSNGVTDGLMNEYHQMVEDVDPGVDAVDSSSMRNSSSTYDEDSDDDIIMIKEIVISRDESSQSEFVTASTTPSHTPLKIERQDLPKRVGTSAVAIQISDPVTHNDGPVEESWTGRLRGRRKPRQHYQPEDSFEC